MYRTPLIPVFYSFFSLPSLIQEVGYSDAQSHPGYKADQQRAHIDDGMYLAHDELHRENTDECGDADGQPSPLETVVKDAFVCVCNEYEERADAKDGENVPEILDVLLKNQCPITKGNRH